MSYIKSLFLFKAQGKGNIMDYKKVGKLYLNLLIIFLMFLLIFSRIFLTESNFLIKVKL